MLLLSYLYILLHCNELRSESLLGYAGKSCNCKAILITKRHSNIVLIAIHGNRCYTRYGKPLKNRPLDVAKKYVEMYSSSKAVAGNPKERVKMNITHDKNRPGLENK